MICMVFAIVPVGPITAALDAGGWMGERFAGTRIPTWDEVLALVREKAGVYPEALIARTPEVHAGPS